MSQVLPSSGGLSLEASLGLGIAVTVLAGLCVAVRIKTNWRSKFLDHVGDGISIIAVAFIAGTVAGQWEIITRTSDIATPLEDLVQLNYAVVWVGSIAMWSSKVPLLLLYVQLFGIKPWVKVVSYTVIGTTASIFIVFAALTTARCDPGSKAVDLPFITACAEQAADSGFALGLTAVLSDAIIFLIPIPVIWHLNLSMRKKIGLLVVFSTGLLTIAVSAISTNYKRRSKEGYADGTTGAMICTIVECAVALMVGCVPALYGFWTRTIITSSFYSKISSLSPGSLVRLRASNDSTSTKKIRSKQSADSSEHINHTEFPKSDGYHEQSSGIPLVPRMELQYMSHHSQRDAV